MYNNPRMTSLEKKFLFLEISDNENFGKEWEQAALN